MCVATGKEGNLMGSLAIRSSAHLTVGSDNMVHTHAYTCHTYMLVPRYCRLFLRGRISIYDRIGYDMI